MRGPKLYAAIWNDKKEKRKNEKEPWREKRKWDFYRLSDGRPTRGPRGDYVVHLATGRLWVQHRLMLEKLGAHLIAIPRSYLQNHKHIF